MIEKTRKLLIIILLFVLTSCTSSPSPDNGAMQTSVASAEASSALAKPTFSYVVFDESTGANLSAETNASTSKSITSVAPCTDDNPYSRYPEVAGEWRYSLYEIFRGAETVSTDETIHYKWEYSYALASESQDGTDELNKFTCKVSLPHFMQTIYYEPWIEQVNAYYQDILLDHRKESDDFWNKSFDVWWHQYSLTYYHENAYRIGNVLSVMRSRFDNTGSRLSLGWVPFADLFSTHNGQKLELDDLFQVGREEYLPILHSSLLNARDRFKEGYYTDTEWEDWFWSMHSEDRIRNFENASVAVTPVGLVFIYPPGMASSNASGVVFLDVPYVDLQSLLNPLFFANNM